MLTAARPKQEQTRKEHVLRAIPGIGPETARRLLREFGSITNIINAGDKELMQVPGLGKKRVEQIHSVIREEPAAYGVPSEKVRASAPLQPRH